MKATKQKKPTGLTLVEVMMVVMIAGILAVVASSAMQGRIDASKWSEAKTATSTIATALRTYAVEKPNFLTVPTLEQIGISPTDINGTYFSHESYEITSASAANGVLSFVITVTAANSTKSSPPDSPTAITLTVVSGGKATWSNS